MNSTNELKSNGLTPDAILTSMSWRPFARTPSTFQLSSVNPGPVSADCRGVEVLTGGSGFAAAALRFCFFLAGVALSASPLSPPPGAFFFFCATRRVRSENVALTGEATVRTVYRRRKKQRGWRGWRGWTG